MAGRIQHDIKRTMHTLEASIKKLTIALDAGNFETARVEAKRLRTTAMTIIRRIDEGATK